MLKHIPILAGVAVAVTCFLWSPASGDGAAERRSKRSVAELVDGSWVLRVDRYWNGGRTPDPSSGSGRLDETQYRPISDSPTYSIVVSDEGSQVRIHALRSDSTGPIDLWGSRVSSGEEIIYALEGSFAGAAFVVWSREHGIQGELTIHGSGVPIRSSERGSIVREH